MRETISSETQSTLVLPAYPARLFRVCDGVNLGDDVGQTKLLCTGDTYRLSHDAQALSLALSPIPASQTAQASFTIEHGSEIEMPGIQAAVAARLTLMTAIGALVEALVIQCDAPSFQSYFHPLGPLEPGTEYSLISVEVSPTNIPLTDLTAMSFGRGTRITLSDGTQCPVETLSVGDRVLTRDNGMKPILWLGRRTVQAVGSFAPVVITPGVLGNAENVTVAQHHRILISDWRAEVMVGARDVLIQAKELVNDDTVFIRSGGFEEYTQIVFDQHQVIYAEGVPSESLELSDQIMAELPADVAAAMRRSQPKGQSPAMRHNRMPLNGADAAKVLKQTGRFASGRNPGDIGR